MFLTSIGIILGVVFLYGLLSLGQPILVSRFELYIQISALSLYEVVLLGVVLLLGTVAGAIPGWKIYHYSLSDGMTIKT